MVKKWLGREIENQSERNNFKNAKREPIDFLSNRLHSKGKINSIMGWRRGSGKTTPLVPPPMWFPNLSMFRARSPSAPRCPKSAVSIFKNPQVVTEMWFFKPRKVQVKSRVANVIVAAVLHQGPHLYYFSSQNWKRKLRGWSSFRVKEIRKSVAKLWQKFLFWEKNSKKLNAC